MSLEQTLREVSVLHSERWNLFFQGKIIIQNNLMKEYVLFYDNEIHVSTKYDEIDKGDELKVLSLMLNPESRFLETKVGLDDMVDNLIREGLGVGRNYDDYIFISRKKYFHLFNNRKKLCSDILEILCDMIEYPDYKLFDVSEKYGNEIFCEN